VRLASEPSNTAGPGPIYTAHRLKNAARNDPERLRSLLLVLAVERTHVSSVLWPSPLARAPASQFVEDPPCQGLGRIELLAPPPPGTRRRLGSPVRDALLRSLQPTSCHEYPPISQLPSVALARFRSLLRPPPLHACAYTRWKRRARLRRRRTIAGTPTPGGDAIVRRVHQLRHLPPSRLRRSLDETQLEGGLPAFLRGERPVRACSASHEPDGHAAGVLCRAPDTARRSEPALEAPRTHPLAMRQHRAVMSPERLPSIDPSNARRASPPHFPWPPLLPRFGRRGAASDMGLRARGAR
jgi:hypothetical protein